MKNVSKKSILVGLGLAVLVVLSLFAPTPLTRTVQADESAACKGLQNAYYHCSTNGGQNNCGAIFEQLLAHGCRVNSGSGSR